MRHLFFSLPMFLLPLLVTTTNGQEYSLTILHNNDGESRVVNAGDGLEEYGGIARFATMVNQTRSYYQGQGHGVLTISSGDNFLAGAEFEASRNDGTYYDALALSQINYDAVILGNHEFDFGTSTLSGFISDAQGTNATTFLSANLDFSGDSALNAQVTSGNIAKSKTVTVATSVGDKTIGIIGATTENLPFISSPGDVTVNNVAAAVNSEIAALKSAGVDHIVLASHLQGIAEDQALVAQLDEGVDLMIAGGGDDRLASPGADSPTTVYDSSAPGSIVDTGFVPGDDAEGAYPTVSSMTDAGGNSIPIVSTDANYKYLGRITLDVDSEGNVSLGASSNPQRIASTNVDTVHGVEADSTVQSTVVDPVSTFVQNLESQIIGTTSQTIIGGGSSDNIRTREQAGGNLVSDAIRAAAVERAGDFGVDAPMIALVNGGGIRADIAAGDVSLKDTFDVSRFQNFVSVVEDVSVSDLKLLLENAYSRVFDGPGEGIDPVREGDGTGRFAQVSGMSVVFDIGAQELVLDVDGNVITAGERILQVMLEDGTMLIDGGMVIDSAATIDIATLNFLALGGDQYFDEDYLSQDYGFTNLGITDQQSLAAFIESFNGQDLAIVNNGAYDSVADGRIVAVPEPFSGTLLLGVLGCGALFRRKNPV